MSAELLAEFMDEVRVMASLSGHPNIVQFIGASVRPPTLCMVIISD